ncbi:hypothetical protein ACFY7Z_06015 [Streptomyces sp. NPDC012623]|uniref:hypothetical protein n=1 Tax=unclassified Streptomyces TaxID=2593676 RepID=UPI0036960CDC
MTTATFTPASTTTDSAARPVGSALRAVRVFLSTMFSVTVMGEYQEEAGVKRR